MTWEDLLIIIVVAIILYLLLKISIAVVIIVLVLVAIYLIYINFFNDNTPHLPDQFAVNPSYLYTGYMADPRLDMMQQKYLPYVDYIPNQ